MQKTLFILAIIGLGCKNLIIAQSITFDSTYILAQVHMSFCVENYQQGYLIAAGGYSSGISHSFVIQTNSIGEKTHVIDSANSYLASSKWVIETSDGGFISADEFSDEVMVGLHFRKYDSLGN
ncbi:MAG: hypothetical protein ABUL44_04790, partial [Flavobacterium sp.]